MTYQVFTKEGFPLTVCSTLDRAMTTAKDLGQVVTIRGPDGMEFVGKFGVDAVENGKTPDGYVYEWSKDFSPGKRKTKRVWERENEEE